MAIHIVFRCGGNGNNNSNKVARRGGSAGAVGRFLFVGILLQITAVFNQMDRLAHQAKSKSADREQADNMFSLPLQPTQQQHLLETRGENFFDVLDPLWPKQPPSTSNHHHCQVFFKNPNLQLCHINPYGQGGNFGDKLGPPIVKRILELAFPGCSAQYLPTFDLAGMLSSRHGSLESSFATRTRPCLFTVGSLWPMVRSGDHLWGTGTARHDDIKARCKKYQQNKNLTVYSSRGPKSAAQIKEYCGGIGGRGGGNKKKDNSTGSSNSIDTMDSAGDAGFLVPFLFPEVMVNNQNYDTSSDQPAEQRSKPYCVVPHAKEIRSNEARQVPPESIMPVAQSWESFAKGLQECQRVVSSSLHGIIFAEAFRIPSRHVGISHIPGMFKFQDFHESLHNGAAEPEPVKGFLSAVNQTLQPMSLEEADGYARRILRSFPMNLFEVEYANEHEHGGRSFKKKHIPGSKDMPTILPRAAVDPTTTTTTTA